MNKELGAIRAALERTDGRYGTEYEKQSVGNVEFHHLSREYVIFLLSYVDHLKKEVEVLRQYGNKECTAMADQRLLEDNLGSVTGRCPGSSTGQRS